jgi:hypothetical protein
VDVDVQPDATVPLDISLGAAIVQLEGVTVTAAQERGSVSAALDQQRTSGQIVNAVTAEQIAHSPDGDAGEAVRRVSGVTVQDGKYVFVRGLGERYTTTSLNNARIPSPEPDRKVVPFDLFPSSLLESITTAKTFTPDQPGDFSGAAVNLKTRDFPLHRHLSISLTGGGNTAATGRNLAQAPTVGAEWLGFAGSARQLPGPARAIARPGDLAALTPAQVNTIIGSFRDAWSARVRTGSEAGSLGANPADRRPSVWCSSDTWARSPIRQVRTCVATSAGRSPSPAAAAARNHPATECLLRRDRNLGGVVGRAGQFQRPAGTEHDPVGPEHRQPQRR